MPKFKAYLKFISSSEIFHVFVKKRFSYLYLTLGSEREPTPLEQKTLHQLKRIFPNRQLLELQMVAKSADNLNEAMDTLLVDRDWREDVSDKKQVCNSDLSYLNCDEVFTTLPELLHHFKQDVKGKVLKLEIDRSELWRMGLSFYKKAMKYQSDFRRPFEVKCIFSIQSTFDTRTLIWNKKIIKNKNEDCLR